MSEQNVKMKMNPTRIMKLHVFSILKKDVSDPVAFLLERGLKNLSGKHDGRRV